MSTPAPNWSKLFAARQAIHRRYRSIWKVPLLRKRFPLILEHVPGTGAVLDVGAAERPFEGRLKRHRPQVDYRSLDIDPDRPHDYRSFDEVDRPFDVVLLLEVIEHLTLAEAWGMLADIRRVLAPGGVLLASTPNIYHPWRYHIDATHKTPFSYENLGGMLLASGFEGIALYRAYNATAAGRLLRFLARPLHRLLAVDYAHTLFAAARRPIADQSGKV